MKASCKSAPRPRLLPHSTTVPWKLAVRRLIGQISAASWYTSVGSTCTKNLGLAQTFVKNLVSLATGAERSGAAHCPDKKGLAATSKRKVTSNARSPCGETTL